MSNNINNTSYMNRVEKVGEGSYGIVYSGKFKDNNEKMYAVKRNFKEKLTSWIGNIHEVDILVRLKGHPCIVELKGVSLGDPFDIQNPMTPKVTSSDKKNMKEDKMHFILEYVNQSGDTYLRSSNFSYANSRLILCQVALALDFMHNRKVIHRDIKPANILINYDNNVPYAKLCDFGMSCNHNKAVPSTPGVVTCWYRAPEICFGHEDYDEKSDVWSLGCLLFEFVGKRAWLQGTPDDDNKIVNSIICGLEDSPCDEDMEYLDKKSSNKIKYKLNDTIRRKLSFESQLKLNYADKQEFEKTCCNVSIYMDLLRKCLQINPEKRISLDDVLDHEFFTPYRSYIKAIRESEYLTSENLQVIISDTCERRWAVNVIIGIYHTKEKHSWYKDLIIFHAIDLFDRFMAWVMSDANKNSNGNKRVATRDNETDDLGKVYNKEDSELAIWVCLYMMHKYYSTLEHPKNWNDFAPSQFQTKKAKQRGKDLEHIIIKYVCNYRIFRNTVFEILSLNSKVDPFNLIRLLSGYVNTNNYIGLVEALYGRIM